MSKGHAISFLSLLICGHSLTSAFQCGQAFSLNYVSIPNLSPMKTPPAAVSGVNLLGGTTSLGLQRSYLDTLARPSTSTKKISINQSSLWNTMSDSSPPPTSKVIDLSSILKYIIAAVTQLSLFSISFLILDDLLAQNNMSVLPSPVTWLIFYAMSLKSRVFNPLNNRRPNAKKAASEEGSPGFKDRIMPEFTPPGFVFPIVWLIIMPSLRATSSTIVVNALGRYCDVAIMTLVFHLTCGDIWNTINNTEKRYGTSVIANVLTYFSAVYASLSYGIVKPVAGKLLGLTCVWLTIASCLITQTWRLNVDENGKKDPILPYKYKGEKSRTKFWFQ